MITIQFLVIEDEEVLRSAQTKNLKYKDFLEKTVTENQFP